MLIGSSNKRGSGAKIILEGPGQLTVEQSIWFGFETSNNQAEYDALIVGLRLAKDLGVRSLKCQTDLQLVVGHMNGLSFDEKSSPVIFHNLVFFSLYFEEFFERRRRLL